MSGGKGGGGVIGGGVGESLQTLGASSSLCQTRVTLPERSPHSQQYRGSGEVKDPGRGQQLMQAHVHQLQLCALFAHVNANGTLAHFSIFKFPVFMLKTLVLRLHTNNNY